MFAKRINILDIGIFDILERWVQKVRGSCDVLQWENLRISRYAAGYVVTDTLDRLLNTE
jgi:hypothetical protein